MKGEAASEGARPFTPFDPSQQRVGRLAAWLVLAVGCVALVALVFGGRVQAPVEIVRPVNDHAGVVDRDIVANLERALRAHRDATGVQMAVLTVDSTGGLPIEDYSHAVAEAWGGGSAARDDGVLFVFAVGDRRMRLEVGDGLEGRIPDSLAARFIGELPPLLRRGMYGEAVALMVYQVVEATGGTDVFEKVGDAPPAEPLAAPPPTKSGSALGAALTTAYRGASPVPQLLLVVGLLIIGVQLIRRAGLDRGLGGAARRARFYSKLNPWPMLAIGLVFGSALLAGGWQTFALGSSGAVVSIPVVVGVIGLVVGLPLAGWAREASLRHWRVQPRGCDEGDGMMRLVDPEGPEGRLTPGQQTEVVILSREYDVWICPSGHRTVEGFAGANPADDCPKCDNATLRRGSWSTVRSATYSSTGLKQRDVECLHCDYQTTESAVIPRKQRSSSSSSGGGWSSGSSGGGWSGGGGSFGGGGASGSW